MYQIAFDELKIHQMQRKKTLKKFCLINSKHSAIVIRSFCCGEIHAEERPI